MYRKHSDLPESDIHSVLRISIPGYIGVVACIQSGLLLNSIMAVPIVQSEVTTSCYSITFTPALLDIFEDMSSRNCEPKFLVSPTLPERVYRAAQGGITGILL